MKMQYLLLTATLLAGCGPNRSANEHDARKSDLRPGEKMAVLPLEPHQWRKDPDCYVSKTAFDSNDVLRPQAQALKWREQRRFSGYLYTNFEGWSFTPAQRKEDPNGLGEGRYYASIYYTGRKIAFAPEPRTYWVTFVGREALCNSQRPDDPYFDAPFSPNLMIIDRFEAQARVL